MLSRNSKGFTFVELIVVISLLGILFTILYPKSQGKETAVKLQATANEVTMLYKACQDWRMVTGSATFTGITMTDLQNKGLWTTATNPLGTYYSVAVSGTDNTKVVITIPTGSLTASQRSQLVNLLLSRGFTSVVDQTTQIVITQ